MLPIYQNFELHKLLMEASQRDLGFEALGCQKLSKLILPLFIALKNAWTAMTWQYPQKSFVLDFGNTLDLLLH